MLKINTNRLWSMFLNLFPSECTDCHKSMRRNDRILMAALSGVGVGVYYRGKGVCPECLEIRMSAALREKDVLFACPFCGCDELNIQERTESIVHPNNYFPEHVECPKCRIHFTGDNAKKRWNTRAL